MTMAKMSNKNIIATDIFYKTHAEDAPYWETSEIHEDEWLLRSVDLLTREEEAHSIGHGNYGSEERGRMINMIMWSIGDLQFRMLWPILTCKKPSGNNSRCARRQSAMAMFYVLQYGFMNMPFIGARNAFFPYLLVDVIGFDQKVTLLEVTTPGLNDLIEGLIFKEGEE